MVDTMKYRLYKGVFHESRANKREDKKQHIEIKKGTKKKNKKRTKVN